MVCDYADRLAAVQETTSTDDIFATAVATWTGRRGDTQKLDRRLSTTADSVAASGDLVKSLPPNSRVLDCACGTGQLAVGLASLGLDVVATDASLGMVRGTFNPRPRDTWWSQAGNSAGHI